MAFIKPSIRDYHSAAFQGLILVGIAGIRRAMQPPKTNSELIADALVALGQVRSENARLNEALSVAIVGVTKCLSMAITGVGGAPSALESPQATKDVSKPEDEDDDLAGASKVEVAIAAIREAGGPLRLSEIIQAFKEMGHAEWATGTSPSAALIKALVRRARHHGDIFKMPGAHAGWDLTERYGPTELAMILNSEVIAQDVAKERQSTRTKAGLAKARARGKKLGPDLMLNRDQAVMFKRMLDDGKSPRAISEALNISVGSYRNYRRRLKDWDEVNGPWPPPPPKDEPDGEPQGERTPLRIIK
jgi:hypothetical protein